MLTNVLVKKPNKLFIYYAIHTKKGTPLGVSFFISENIKKSVTLLTIISYTKKDASTTETSFHTIIYNF